SATAVREVMKVNSFFEAWSEHARRVGWRTAYGAASTRVRQLERQIGRAGLRRFVERLIREGDISTLLREVRHDNQGSGAGAGTPAGMGRQKGVRSTYLH
ncbi:MAG: hypothetical protein KKB37_00960, partial [Alphaproteobacteria bacterium]|nr:hypothetical protein [Alphaproteobacteria bacterium]